ncbi:antiviral reverse transcriptase Drt5 [Pseudomonas sp.]|uniref:antiviral reverse transcriptase Drt5 n=1 Tax=Pseudomonas sp. TaxID=306 RepID=UPI003D11CA8E
MSKTVDFFEKDFWSGLFPMQTNFLMITRKEKELSNYIYQKVLSSDEQHNFLAQQRVHADKANGHLRRTLKLDPIAEYFLYDVVYRNREIFRRPFSEHRKSYGYRFEKGNIVPINQAYKSYKNDVTENLEKFKSHLSFDIAGYFNSIYHHDLSHWFSSSDRVDEKDQEAFGKFFREINSGRSVDFLPHGLYPSKMIGSEFLKFSEQSGQLKSSVILRFMDDYHLFDDDDAVIKKDFFLLQKMLGSKGLNVNPQKTRKGVQDLQAKVSEIREELYDIIEVEVGVSIIGSGVEIPETEKFAVELDLSSSQINQLLSFLKEDSLDDHDAELILNVLSMHSTDIGSYIPVLLDRFPSLSKSIFSSLKNIPTDQDATNKQLAYSIYEFLERSSHVSEFQLFWLAIITESRLGSTDLYGRILNKLYELSSGSIIARAKVLEIPTQNYGMKELREEHLKNGSSDWLSWASAIGSRSLKKAERNYALDYFSKGSSLNFLISSCVKEIT